LSFHGKTGGENSLIFVKIIMTLINSCIINIGDLLKYFPEIEFLSHAPYFENKSVEKIILNNNPKKYGLKIILLEKRGGDAIKQINIYRENKIEVSGMLDIYHYVANNAGSLETNWSDIVSQLKSYILFRDKNDIHFLMVFIFL